ncbi:DNA methyltransferase [Chloroflexota bacterium]
MASKHQSELPFEHNEAQFPKKTIPVTCLGINFENDDARRSHFTDLLSEILDDQAFKSIDGFPLAEDEDILAISDPPYYTACPNPWHNDFIKEWESLRPTKSRDQIYQKEPFAADVSEGKYHPIYKMHSYGTKVPHRAIMRYILHYTDPGDIIFDGFCGTGMTGVAAQMCGNEEEVEALGYKVQKDGTILQENTDINGSRQWIPFSKLGERRVVMNDLSPVATFIAYNINSPVNVSYFKKEAKKILLMVEDECGWMFETNHIDGRLGKINYTAWSDIFICSDCSEELVFWDVAVDKEAGKILSEFQCQHCGAKLSKRTIERAWITRFDNLLGKSIRQAKQVPVLINYSVGKTRYKKEPDAQDLALIERIEAESIPYNVPTQHLPDGYNTEQPIQSHGIAHVHQFYSRRNLWVLGSIINKISNPKLLILVTKLLFRITKLYIFSYQNGSWGAGGGTTAGNFYIPSLNKELNMVDRLYASLDSRLKVAKYYKEEKNFSISTSSLSDFSITKEATIDYIFLDPPFGSNLNYSEINFLWESWLKVWTNNKTEAIENSIQGKGPNEYRKLMVSCFQEAYRLLKPGRWMTVEFSNTKASVWNNIQTALSEAGFIVSNVSILDKQRGGFKSITTPTAVKQDLVISAYKPNGGFIQRFESKAGTEEGVWDFVRTHLSYIPSVKTREGTILQIPERDPRLLYDQVVAYYVRNGLQVPLSSQEFQVGLAQRFVERDSMFFLPDQVLYYDQMKLSLGNIFQTSIFVSDEKSAINWLRLSLKEKRQTYQEIHPQYIQETQRSWNKNEQQIELSSLLEQNFLQDEQGRWYLPDPNKASDLERIRNKALLREFSEYLVGNKKIKQFRFEAVRAGFADAWQRKEYATIVKVAERLPENVLQEDPDLLMYYDNASLRVD